MPLGPAAQYLAKYNGTVLPGYVQNESLPSEMGIASHYATYADGSLSEYTGLQNKMISLTLKVWEQDYLSCKNEVQKAATIARSKKGGFAPLYIQYPDRYYSALTRSIKAEKAAGESVRTLEYVIDFECKPWLYSETVYTISGSNINNSPVTITTTGRTIDEGGWTPTSIKVSGTNVTISGYTASSEFTGFVSISGAVANLVLDSDAFTAKVGATSYEDYMRWVDYRTYVGPEVTHFYVTGAQLCEISYQNRWYI